MKRFILTLSFTFIFFAAQPGIIPDANTFLLSQILGKDIAAVQTMESTFDQIRTFTDFARHTKENIEKMARMEQEVQNALKTAKDIKDFKFSDISYLLEKATSIDTDPSTYIPRTALTASLLSKISNHQGNGEAGIALYRLYHQPLDIISNSGSTQRDRKPKTIQDQLGIERYLAAQQGASYEVLTGFADRFQQQALEIQSSVKKEDLFTMNTSERMQLLLTAGNLMEKSVELKLKAADLLRQQPGETMIATSHAAEYLNIQAACSNRVSASQKTTARLF